MNNPLLVCTYAVEDQGWVGQGGLPTKLECAHKKEQTYLQYNANSQKVADQAIYISGEVLLAPPLSANPRSASGVVM